MDPIIIKGSLGVLLIFGSALYLMCNSKENPLPGLCGFLVIVGTFLFGSAVKEAQYKYGQEDPRVVIIETHWDGDIKIDTLVLRDNRLKIIVNGEE